MNDQSKQLGHDGVDLLLPWYVNGTLSSGEHERAQNHIEACTSCQENVALLEKVQAGVQHELATPIMQSRFDDLLDAIEADSGGAEHRSWLPALALAASITALIIAATLALSNRIPEVNGPTRFETATTAEQAAPLDYVIAVQFEDHVTSSERERILQEIGAVEVSTGSEENTFRVVVRLPATSLEGLERYTQGIGARREVKSASVVALQLPMR
ncbi:MAG: zf-HC2 domain-containing protein [Gammaproteobacteria bacterium]|jgi:anti-sigma factor RsiW|nr:zf-HC2 domain-containing protein [Gammaproteobacteria bacterium]MDH3804258.1 zf-HC2 domain-containing protein [Gammaproteobacteria bacterium]